MPLDIVDNFDCCRCGRCCTNLRTLSMESGNQKLIFRVPENDKIGLPLWQWEADNIRKIVGEQGIEVNIEPLQFFYDMKSEKAVIISWHLNHDSCVFYKPGECTIYEKRPHVCRMFPLISSGIFEFDFGRRPEFSKTVFNADFGQKAYETRSQKEFIENMDTYYGSGFIVAVQNDMINYYIVKKIKHLTMKGIIKPFVYPRGHAIKLFEKSDKITLLDLLKENGIDTKTLVENFISLKDAEKKII